MNKRHGQAADLHGHAVKGAFWNVFFALANKGVTLGGQLALAWYLLPADMGLANMAQAMAAFTAILSVGGIADVLLQRGRFDEEAGQACWLSLGFVLLMTLAMVGMAFASPWLNRPEVRTLLFVLALSTFVGFPATVLAAGLKSKLDFKSLALAQFLGGLLYTTCAIFLAHAGWGPMALLVPLIPQQLLTIALMIAYGSRFTLERPMWSKIRNLAKPTFALSVSGLFTALQSQAPIFVCGLVLSPAGTGYFSWGWSVAGQAVFLLATNLREVLLPIFTQLKNDHAHRAQKALEAARVITALLCIACGTQALLAGPMIHLLVPDKWLPAIPVVIIASFGLLLQGLWISGMAWLNACGRYRSLLKLSALQAALTASLTWIGSHFSGPVGAAAGYALANLIGAVACVTPMGYRVLYLGTKSWWKPMGLSLAIWIGCLVTSHGQGMLVEISAAAVFLSLSGVIWWWQDDGGLASVIKKLKEIILLRRRNAVLPS